MSRSGKIFVCAIGIIFFMEKIALNNCSRPPLQERNNRNNTKKVYSRKSSHSSYKGKENVDTNYPRSRRPNIETQRRPLIIKENANPKPAKFADKKPNNNTRDKKPNYASNEEYSGTCLTKGCKLAADVISKDMDKNVDPCDDFYKYACGNYLKNTEVPPDIYRISAVSNIADKIARQVRAVLSEPIRKIEPRPYRIMKTIYATCMNTRKLERLGVKPALDMLRKLGGWPVLEGNRWNAAQFKWTDSVYRFRRHGLRADYFMSFSIGAQYTNTTARIIEIDEADFGLSSISLKIGMDGNHVQAYYTFMVDIAVLFGANPEYARKELGESLKFEMRLAEVALTQMERRDLKSRYNVMTISEMQRRYPFVQWLEYINNILITSKVTWDETVAVPSPKYIQHLGIVLRETPKRVQANYVMWRAVKSFVHRLNAKARDIGLEFNKVIDGILQAKPRWRHCVDNTKDFLAVESMYVRRYVSARTREKASDMALDIQREMHHSLKTITWMDDITRENAIAKLKAIIRHVAYPDELLDFNRLNEYYKSAKYYPGEHFKSALAWYKWRVDEIFSKLHEPLSRRCWITHSYPTTINAFYEITKNSIIIPAGILQPPFFSADRPRYLNYGAIGFVIGHEFTHGFDDTGSDFDEKGNLFNWWEPNTRSRYLEKIQCMINQYENYQDDENDVNGALTIGENVADNGGVRIAYRAYIKWVKRNNREKKLPGFQNFTNKQLFWLSMANSWCRKQRRTSDQVSRSNTIVHAPGNFRIIGSLSNQQNFAHDFNCPKGSRMNPTEKCKVW